VLGGDHGGGTVFQLTSTATDGFRTSCIVSLVARWRRAVQRS
jgi:hypothetical protein